MLETGKDEINSVR